MYQTQIRKLVYIAVLTALAEAAKWSLNAVANVELVSLLFMVYTVCFGIQTALPVVLLFAGIESLWWGISIWTIPYFYVWPVLVWVTWHLRRDIDRWKAAVISGCFGYVFGALCAVTTLVISGPAAAFAWWVAGIPYDLVHGTANALIAFILFEPLVRTIRKMKIQI
jgi:energy-coupling factor transport system substrate-specific component